ncbi:unnamed protein product [Lota lota]
MTWPILITVRQGEEDGSEPEVSISWFFTPGTQLPISLDASISKEVRPAGKVYVRSFSGPATQSKASSTADELREMLTLAGKSFRANTYTGAFYDSPWDIGSVHHTKCSQFRVMVRSQCDARRLTLDVTHGSFGA